jgi:hypothetical protein
MRAKKAKFQGGRTCGEGTFWRAQLRHDGDDLTLSPIRTDDFDLEHRSGVTAEAQFDFASTALGALQCGLALGGYARRSNAVAGITVAV